MEKKTSSTKNSPKDLSRSSECRSKKGNTMAKLWGSRFKAGTDKLADQFTFSVSYDHRLAKYDVIASIAHAAMLGKSKIISKSESASIVSGLKKILGQIEAGKFRYDPSAEDIHSDIQNKLRNLIGDAADKLHTARSRNDQVVTDVKLYCRDHMQSITERIVAAQKAILNFAQKNKTVIIPAYTHLQ